MASQCINQGFVFRLFLASRPADARTENILFSLPYDAERYNKTLEACALITDLEILEDGDEAEIGERGVPFFSLAVNILLTVIRSIFLVVKRPGVSLLAP